MLSPETLAKVREQVGIPKVGMGMQNTLNSRASTLSSAWGTQTTTPSVPEAPAVPVRHPIFDTLVQGVTAAKNRVAEAANNLPDPRTHEGAEQVEHLVGGFAGLGSNKVAGAVATKGAELLDKVLTEHITSSKQIIQNLPKEDFAQLGGMPALLDRTRINIADALKAYKLPEAEKEVRNLDLSKFKSLDDFTKDVTTKLNAHLKDHVETAAEVQHPAFEGFDDLSTKLLESLKGRTTVSKQFIEESTNQAGLKQPERDLIRKMLADEGENVDVKSFANKVKSELLPLERTGARDMYSTKKGETGGRYEHITLPDELRGPVANYSEHIYNSPIKTSAGDVHFGQPKDKVEGYFAHSRIEDLPASETLGKGKDAFTSRIKNGEYSPMPDGDTRRVIEIQSDLFQKGRLENEYASQTSRGNRSDMFEMLPSYERDEYYNLLAKKGDLKRAQELEEKARKLFDDKVAPDKAKLEPYRNTWHERVIREEVKQAAKDGKTKLQFPTGETAMKIEGLGDTTQWSFKDDMLYTKKLTADKLKVGQEVQQGAGNELLQRHNLDDRGSWIITDVLGDGKFKAIQKVLWDDYTKGAGKTASIEDFRTRGYNSQQETFDISGNVDKENPIFKFYDKEVAKYLKNKYGATQITDPQGVTWFEVNIKPEMKKLPIEAFGALAIPALGNPQAQVDKNDTIRP